MAVELKQASHGASTPTVRLRDGDQSRPLYFVHSLGCDAWIYRELVEHLRFPGVVYGLQLPGIDTSASASDDLETLASEYVHRIRFENPLGSYRIAGYSSGGMLAYEMARQLTAAGEQVEFLGLIDAGVPPVSESKLSGSKWRRIATLFGRCPELVRDAWHLGWSYCLRRMRQTVRLRIEQMKPRSAANDVTKNFDDEKFYACFANDVSFFNAERLRQIKEHYQAVFRYEAGPWRGEADLFRVRRQPLSSVPTRTLGWEHLIAGAIRVYDVPGTHTTLMEAPHAVELAAAFDAALARRAATSIDEARTSPDPAFATS